MTTEANYKKYLNVLKQCGSYVTDSSNSKLVYSNGKNRVVVSSEYTDEGSFCVYVGSEDLWEYFHQNYS